MDWQAALAYCEDARYLAGYDDWRLPNAKELQSLVDYSRAPDATGSAAIDPLFSATPITNEAGQADYAAYWSSTTHLNTRNGANAAYVAFGRALGYMNGWIDIHGAGAQRSDPKTGDPAAYPTGHGPQGDAIRIDNFARCVRAGSVTLDPDGDPTASRPALHGQRHGLRIGRVRSRARCPGSKSARRRAALPRSRASLRRQAARALRPTAPRPRPPSTRAAEIAQGTACQFQSPQGQITGTCLPAGGALACVPAGGPPG